MTNREKINRMSNEEIAEGIAEEQDSELYRNITDEYCLNLCPHRNKAEDKCDGDDDEYNCPGDKKAILMWLKSEAIK